MVEALETIKASRLHDELDRLSEQYAGNLDALQVVDAVRMWLMEETVSPADDTGVSWDDILII